jgi:hypothetical protein
MSKWWNLVGRNSAPKLDKDNLDKYIPRPTRNLDHVLPYRSDDWGTIEAIKRGADPHMQYFKLRCLGCNIEVSAMMPGALFAKEKDTLKWVCEDCLDHRGFAWASTIDHKDLVGYQVVKEFKDDTLMRRLDKSPNHKDALHDPFDPDDNRRIVG